MTRRARSFSLVAAIPLVLGAAPAARDPSSPAASQPRIPVSTAENDRRIDYIEFPAPDIAAAKRFYVEVFGWTFEDYGPDYASFSDGRLTGGLDGEREVRPGGALVVIYAADLGQAEARVRAAGGKVVRETFEFPGGRRFHFTDPGGNELAVWSDR